MSKESLGEKKNKQQKSILCKIPIFLLSLPAEMRGRAKMEKKGSKTTRKKRKIKKRNLYLTPIQTKRFFTTRAPSELHAIMKNGPIFLSFKPFFFLLERKTAQQIRKENSLSVNITSFFFISFFSQNKLFVRIMDLISSTKGKKLKSFFCFNIFCLNLTRSEQ